MNRVIEEDIRKAILPQGVMEQLYGKTILITGATGLIGSQLVYFLSEKNKSLSEEDKIRLVVWVRNKKKAEMLFQKIDNICMIQGDIRDKAECPQRIDYIIHGASNTASREFVEHPVDTTDIILQGTQNLLQLAVAQKVQSFVYLSSMEAYGFVTEKIELDESSQEYVNPLSVRSCYPMGKRMAENMCISYCSQYQLPIKIIRLAQTFGAGVSHDDTRVFAEFAKCALAGQDIHMLTDGASRRMYLYTMDAVTAILTVLVKGNNGEAYNAANQDTFASIRDMAELVIHKIANDKIKLTIEENSDKSKKFPPPHCLFLVTDKIQGLGWQPQVGLEEMYHRMIESWE